jgi:hypothetical protein
MELIDYIDADEGRDFEDASCSVAVLTCENCKTGCERLTRVPEFDYMGCDECMEEALAVIKRRDCEQVEMEEALAVIEREQAEAAVTSAAADFLRAFPTGRPRFRGTFGSHFVASRRSF